jgi:serine/threonine-protein kinase
VLTDDTKEDTIRRALERVLSSPGFSRNERLSGFLRFLVEKHLEGRDSEIKESVIAHEVFGRQAGYDPKVDAIVRTEAIRLRARLEKYYQAEGSQDPLVIELPKGGYRPVFRERGPAEPESGAPPVPAAARAPGRRSWWVAAAATVAFVAAGSTWWATRASRPVTIAVLPFDNLNKDEGTDYFADGLTDEIIRNLAVIDGLTVRSRTSSFALKGKGPSEAGRQLGVDYLVEGSVLVAGDQLRVNAALVSARDGSLMWSDRYDRKLTDVFAIQDETSRGIVNALRLTLSGRRRYEAKLEAYDLYLRGRQIMAQFPSGLRPVALPAIEYFEGAVEKDPNYAIAYAGMADAYLAIDRNMGAAAPIDAWGKARAAAVRALELDPMLSEAHSAMASIRAREYAWQGAEDGFRRAIALNPNNALAHLELGTRVLLVQGRFEDGLNEVRQALALDPLSPFVNTEAGEALIDTRRYGEAVEQLRKAIALDPSRNRPYNLMARALYLQGKLPEAVAARNESLKIGTQIWATDWLGCLEVRAGRREEALRLIEEFRNSAQRSGPMTFTSRAGVTMRAGARRSSVRLAKAHACLGEAEQALALLDKALGANEPGLPEVLHAPELDALRSDPRFMVLQKRLNLQ